MNFKSLLLVFIFAFSSCSDFLKGKKTSDHVITVEENEACLKKFPEVFDKFLESKINGEEIDQALGCLNSTLTRFQSKFRGQQAKDVFSIDDITTIFNFFFKDLKISRETSEKLIRFKFALIGGEQQSLSKVDVENLKQFLKDLSVELKNISKWVAVFRSDNGTIPESSIKSAFGQLRMSLINLINSGHISKTQYSVEDFLLLLKQFNFNLKPYSEQIDQLLVVKKFLIGDDYVNSKESYTAAIELILDIMQLNAMIENHHFKFDLKKPETQKRLIDLMTAAIRIMKSSPRMKTEGQLHLLTLKELVKFESPLLTFENLLTIKMILVGGTSHVLTRAEVDLFEKRSQEIIGAAYKAAGLMKIKTIEEFLAASADLQSTLKLLFDVTFIDDFLAQPDFSMRLFAALQNLFKAQSVSGSDSVDIQAAFEQIVDPGTLSSKKNVLDFLKGLTGMLQELKDHRSVEKMEVTSRLKTAQVLIVQLHDLIGLKSARRLDAEILLKGFGLSSERLNEGRGILNIFYPMMDLTSINTDDLQTLHHFLQITVVELKNLTKFPETTAEFESFKKSLKPILAATNFYSGHYKTHWIIAQLLKYLPADIGPSKGLKDFLTVLVADREIKSFDEISSVMNSLFSAYQLSKKLSASGKKLGLDLIQDFVSVLMVSDAMRIGKQLDLNQLVQMVQALPQASASLSQINLGMKYLKILFPNLRNGIADQVMMQKMFAFIFILSQEKNSLSAWPETVEQAEAYKSSIERLLAATDFFKGKSRSRELLISFLNVVLENSPQVKQSLGDNTKLFEHVIELLVADRELTSFADIHSILDTVFDGLALYKEWSNQDRSFTAERIKRVIKFLQQCDHMSVLKFIRFDLAIKLVLQWDPRAFDRFDLSESEILFLKANILGAPAENLTLTEVESLNQLFSLFEKKGSLSVNAIEPKKILDFFSNPESVRVFNQMFNPGREVDRSGLADVAGQVFKLSTTVLRLKSEMNRALLSKDFMAVITVSNSLIDELLKLPLFQKSGVLDLNVLQKVLRESLNIQISMPENLYEIKRYLLGGVGHQITRQDLLDLKKMIDFVHKNYQEVYRALKILYFDRSPTYSIEEIEAAAQIVKEKSFQFVQITQLAKSGLQFPTVMILIKSFLQPYSINLDSSLIETGHKLLVGPYFNYSLEHFRLLISTYVDVVQVVRYSQMGFVKLQIRERSEFLITMNALDVLFNVFENSISFAMSRHFETKYLDSLVAYLLKKGVIPYQVTPAIFSSFYKRMLNMVFSNPRKDSDQLEFVSEQQFLGLKNEMILFKYFIHVIDGAFTESQYGPEDVATKNANLKWSINRQMVKFSQDYQSVFVTQPEFFKKAIETYRQEIMFKKGILFSDGYVISHNQNDYFSSWADQMRAHYIRTLARLLIQGWGLKNGNEIESAGLVKWYSDFKEFSIAIKNFDPRSGNSGERSMLEANLFTFSGNGDKKLNFKEATQFIALLMTGGSSQFTKVYELAKKANCLTGQSDPVGASYIKEACVVGVYAQYYEKIFPNLNWFVRYLSELKDNSARYQFFHDVMLASRSPLNKSPDLESLDLRTMNMILMYTESIFSVLDVDRNDKLSPAEIRAGFSGTDYARFENVIYSMAKKSSQAQLEAFAQDTLKAICRKFESAESNKKYLAREAFIYLLFYGKMPEQKEIISWKRDENAAFVEGTWDAVKNSVGNAIDGIAETTQTAWNCGRKGELFKFDGEVDRKMMINTFKVLKSVLASEK